jgi:hypothetical protein
MHLAVKVDSVGKQSVGVGVVQSLGGGQALGIGIAVAEIISAWAVDSGSTRERTSANFMCIVKQPSSTY